MKKYIPLFLLFLIVTSLGAAQNITENSKIVVNDTQLEVYDVWKVGGEELSPKSLVVQGEKPRGIQGFQLEGNTSGDSVNVSLEKRGSLYWLTTPADGNIIFSYTLDVQVNKTISFSHPTALYSGNNSYLIRKVRIESPSSDTPAELEFPKKFTDETKYFTGGMKITSIYQNRSEAKKGRTFRVTRDESVRDYTNLYERVEIRPDYEDPSSLEYTINKKANPNFNGYSYILGESDELIDIPRDSISLLGSPDISFAKNADKVARSNCESPVYTLSDVKLVNKDARELNICIPDTSKPRFTLSFKTIQNIQEEQLNPFKKKLTYHVSRYHPKSPSHQELVLIEPENTQLVVKKGENNIDVNGRETVKLRKGEELELILADKEKRTITAMNAAFLVLSLALIIGSHKKRIDWSLTDYIILYFTYVITLFSAFRIEKLFSYVGALPLIAALVISLTLYSRVRAYMKDMKKSIQAYSLNLL